MISAANRTRLRPARFASYIAASAAAMNACVSSIFRPAAAPTLIVTGEAHLDYVVPVEGSAEYERLIAGARRRVLPSTGHLGSMTRPVEFAAVIRTFVEGLRDAAA